MNHLLGINRNNGGFLSLMCAHSGGCNQVRWRGTGVACFRAVHHASSFLFSMSSSWSCIRIRTSFSDERSAVNSGLLLQGAKHGEGLFSTVCRDKQVVMAEAGEDVATDAGCGQSRCHGGGEADRRQVGMDREADPGCTKAANKAMACRFLLADHQGQSLGFADGGHHRESFQGRAEGDGSVDEDPWSEDRFEGGQQAAEVSGGG